MKIIDQITLYCREGSADKVYQVQLAEVDGGYTVIGFNGRRGSALKAQPKTQSPIPLDKARAVYDALVREKERKKYVPGPDTEGYVPAAQTAMSASGPRPAQPEACDSAATARYVADDAYLAQQKEDGVRCLVQVGKDGIPCGFNGNGKPMALPIEVVERYMQLNARGCTFDGELVGASHRVFDLLEFNGVDYTGQPCGVRVRQLAQLLINRNCRALYVVATAWTTADKQLLHDRLAAAEQEGLVFKRVDAPYISGKLGAKSTQWKRKFYETAWVIVTSMKAGKRSVGIAVLDPQGRRIDVGFVTVPANQAIPAPGAILDVKYLYAYKGGALAQPSFLTVRDDIAESDCTVDQLKYNPQTA